MHTQIINGKKFFVADTLQEAFIDWYGAEVGNELFEATKRFKQKTEKCVYILNMKNGTVKIGITANFDRRLRQVITSSGSDVDEWVRTDYLNSSKAYKIENACHRKFRKCRQKGEFFKITFVEACDELKQHSPIIDKCVQQFP